MNVSQPEVSERYKAESFAEMSFVLGAHQAGGLYVSIVTLFCIHNTLPLQFPDDSSQGDSGRRRQVSDQIFDPCHSGWLSAKEKRKR